MRKKRFQSTSYFHGLNDVVSLADKLGYDIQLYIDSHSKRCTVRAYHGDPMHEVFIFISDNLAFVLEHSWQALNCILHNDLPF